MKQILAMILVSTLFTGCASTTGEGSYGKMIALGFVSPEMAGEEAIKLGLAKRPKDPIEQASENCQKIGYRQGTNDFKQCVVATANNIRTVRANEAVGRSVARELAPRSYGPKTTTCNRVGSSVQCTEF